jgi:hypothetical protein
VERRRVAVHVPALDAKAVAEPLDVERPRLVGVLLGAAERLGVDEGEVREVAQVVDDQEPVGVVVHVRGHASPGRVVQRPVVDDQCRVGERGIAHPDPDQVVSGDDRIAAHAELRGNDVLAGDLDAPPGRLVLHAVVHAADAVAFDATHRQRRAPVAAAVLQRDHLAALALVEDDRPFEDRAGQLGAVDQLVVPGGHVPAVLQEDSIAIRCHAWSPRSRALPGLSPAVHRRTPRDLGAILARPGQST